VRIHDPVGEAGVLKRISGLGFNQDGLFRNSLSVSGLGHYARFNKTIVSGAAGEDEPRRHPALVFVDRFSDAGQLDRGWIAVGVGRRAQHDDGVKASERSIGNRRKLAGQSRPA